MPPWRKGRGLGPFTSARPTAGPLLSSQPHAAANHPEQPLSAILATPMSTCGAWPGRCAPPTSSAFRLTWAHQPVGHGWPYRVLTATAVAVGQSLEGSIDAPTPGPDVGARPAATHVGSESMHRQLSAASPSEPRVGRPAVASGQVRVARGARREAAPLRSYGLEYGPEVWRETRRLLLRRGEQAPAVSGTKSSSRTHGGCQATGPPRSPAPQTSSECPRQQGSGGPSLPASVPYGTASAHRHPARVWHPERH
jgi:hypothetical protein